MFDLCLSKTQESLKFFENIKIGNGPIYFDEMKEIFAAPEKRKRGRPKKTDQEKATKLEAKTAKEKTKKKPRKANPPRLGCDVLV